MGKLRTEAYYDVGCAYCGKHLSTDYHRGMFNTRVEAAWFAKHDGFRTVDGRNACPECVEMLKGEK